MTPEGQSGKRAQHRILLVEQNEDGTVGGSHRGLHHLATRLDRTRYEPTALFYEDNPYVERLRARHVNVHQWEGRRRTERSRMSTGSRLHRLRGLVDTVVHRIRFLASEEIDLVHLNNAASIGYDEWLPAAKLAGVPCVTHERGYGWPIDHPVKRFLVHHFDRVIAVSDYVRDRLLDSGFPTDRVVRIYNGIDAETFRAEATADPTETRRRLGATDEDCLAVMVGHLREWKGHAHVLRALAHLDASHRSRLRVVFVGEAGESEKDYLDDLHEMVDQEELGGSVSFLGARDDVPDLMNASDLVLHASVSAEPFGRVLLEGMALGKPVLAADIGGPREILTPECGMLADPRHPSEYAGHLVELMDDPRLRSQLGEQARERVDDFSVEKTIGQIESIYAALLSSATR